MRTPRPIVGLLVVAMCSMPLAASLEPEPALDATLAAANQRLDDAWSSADLQGLVVDEALRGALDEARPTPVVAVFEPGTLDAASSKLTELGLAHRPLSHLSMAGILVTPATLPLLGHVPGLKAVWKNEESTLRVDESAEYVGARVVSDTYGYSGAGVTILVMDSGIDGTHPDLRFGSKLLENVVPKRGSNGLVEGTRSGVVSSDVDGHGTHVAGIAASLGQGWSGKPAGPHRGVAWGSSLVGFQAGLRQDDGAISFEALTVLEGFNWALENQARFNIRVVSNSWGANGDFDPRSPVNIATLNLYKAGMVVVFAAGNEGSEGGHTLNKYAVAPWVLAVTAGDYVNQVPGFASRGTDARQSGLPYDHPDVVAPGVGITSTRRLASGSDDAIHVGQDSLYTSKSGSSMAAPHVSGLAALLLQANPQLSPDDVMDLLTASATPMPRSPEWESGAGYVNGLRAFQLAQRAQGQHAAFMAGNVKYAGPASGDPAYARDPVSVGYLRGEANPLRSPDKSVAEFGIELVSTPHGLTFLVGSVTLVGLAFGAGAPPAGLRVRRAAWRTHSPLPAPERVIGGAAARALASPPPGPLPSSRSTKPRIPLGGTSPVGVVAARGGVDRATPRVARRPRVVTAATAARAKTRASTGPGRAPDASTRRGQRSRVGERDPSLTGRPRFAK